ncbi:MAG: methylated-DNA--[protein]-cysteine S-methyltransferase [Bdellovibrionales bacterium]
MDRLEIKRLKKKPSNILYCVKKTQYGDMMVGTCDEGICWLGFDLDGSVMKSRFSGAQFIEALNVDMDKPLAVYGTDFQVSVWEALLDIPSGVTVQYQDIAKRLGRPKAHRAVGTAVGANPISVLIPCHRVLPASGGVGNYLWDSDKKRQLLGSEGASF